MNTFKLVQEAFKLKQSNCFSLMNKHYAKTASNNDSNLRKIMK